jgi:group II intron reverse transcriptase/maturase
MAKGSRCIGKRESKDTEMVNKTERTLAIYSERGKQGKRLNNVYRQLYQRELYEQAYAKIYANLGATTRGTGEETLDGMSTDRMDNIIEALKVEQYRWKPVRRTYIPRNNGKSRPLGLPSGDDKLLQSAMRLLLEAYYEPTFSDRSHGFRPGRGCLSALKRVNQRLRDTNWFIEGDIKGCFDNIDHDTLIGIMAEKIDDNRFLSLTRKLLKAGYTENWVTHRTYSGTPQGGIISPLLTNIYLDKFDKWVENELLPKHNRSLHPKPTRGRRDNPEHKNLTRLRSKAKSKGDHKAYKEYGRQMRNLPSVIPDDEGFRKLEYVRYADDFLLSFAGPKSEAIEIKKEIGRFLKDTLKLEMSDEKTLITHARTSKAKFLGYEVKLFQGNHKKVLNGGMQLRVPKEVIKDAMRKYSRKGKPVHRGDLMREPDFEIVLKFQAEHKGLVEYYRMAHNVHALAQVRWVTETSLLKTLAAKHKMTVSAVSKKYRSKVKIGKQEYKVIEMRHERKNKKPLIARFGAVPLARVPNPKTLADEKPTRYTNRSGLITRMSANKCEMCGDEGYVEVHHVRKLKDVNKPGRRIKPWWIHRMASLRRKTLICCHECHRAIHGGRHLAKWEHHLKDTLESRVL